MTDYSMTLHSVHVCPFSVIWSFNHTFQNMVVNECQGPCHSHTQHNSWSTDNLLTHTSLQTLKCMTYTSANTQKLTSTNCQNELKDFHWITLLTLGTLRIKGHSNLMPPNHTGSSSNVGMQHFLVNAVNYVIQVWPSDHVYIPQGDSNNR